MTAALRRAIRESNLPMAHLVEQTGVQRLSIVHDGRWSAEMRIGVGSNTTRLASRVTREECERAVAEFLGSADAKRLESVYAE